MYHHSDILAGRMFDLQHPKYWTHSLIFCGLFKCPRILGYCLITRHYFRDLPGKIFVKQDLISSQLYLKDLTLSKESLVPLHILLRRVSFLYMPASLDNVLFVLHRLYHCIHHFPRNESHGYTSWIHTKILDYSLDELNMHDILEYP